VGVSSDRGIREGRSKISGAEPKTSAGRTKSNRWSSRIRWYKSLILDHSPPWASLGSALNLPGLKSKISASFP